MVENKFEKKTKHYKLIGEENGIELFMHPCPHTSQQNGLVIRKHRHIVEMGLTQLAQPSMPIS